MMTAKGVGGEVRVGEYQRAAGIGTWSLKPEPSDPSMGRVDLILVDPDPYWMEVGPDTLALRLGSRILTFGSCRLLTDTTWEVRGNPVVKLSPEEMESASWQTTAEAEAARF
jgi:hypothetical protein